MRYIGHHHLIVDAPLPPLDKAIPSDKNHLYFGKGQTGTRITLPVGRVGKHRITI